MELAECLTSLLPSPESPDISGAVIKVPGAMQGRQSFTLARETGAAKQGDFAVGEPELCLAGTEAKKSP